MAESKKELKGKLIILKKELSIFGLNINTEKSKLIIFGMDKNEDVECIKQVDSINYLGISISNERNIFKKFIDMKIQKAKGYKYWINSILRKKVLKALIGKVLWKGSILPTILHGAQAIYWNRKQIKEMDSIQRQIMKMILNMPKHTANAYIQGEMGITNHFYRDIKLKLGLLQHIYKNNIKLKSLVQEEWNNTSKWIRSCKEYLNKMNIDITEIEELTTNELKQKVNHKENEEWKIELENNKRLRYYKDRKKEIKYEKDWRNNKEETISRIFQSGSILTKDIVGQEDKKKCDTCNEIETLEHILKDCKVYKSIRNKHKINSLSVMTIIFEKTKYLMELYEEWRKNSINLI